MLNKEFKLLNLNSAFLNKVLLILNKEYKTLSKKLVFLNK